VFARNTAVLVMLREWGKNACKKEEFEETLMGWLQVSMRTRIINTVVCELELVSETDGGLIGCR